MFGDLLPRQLDNTYRGRKSALWIFAVIVAVRILQSIVVIFNGYSIARSADGIPLDTYARGAAQTVVALFSLSALNRLFLALLCAVVLVRYRRAISFMFVLLIVAYLASQLILRFVPIESVGAPPGNIVNLVLFVMMIAGLALSLWKRPDHAGDTSPTRH